MVMANQHARLTPGPARVEGVGGTCQDPQMLSAWLALYFLYPFTRSPSRATGSRHLAALRSA